MWTISKVFIESVTTLLLFFMFWCFDHEAWGGLSSPPPQGSNLHCLHWKVRSNPWIAREVPVVFHF